MTLFEKQNIVLKRDNAALKLMVDAQAEKIVKFQAEWSNDIGEKIRLRMLAEELGNLLAWAKND